MTPPMPPSINKSDPFWHTMVLLALRTGLRLSELKGLQWEDINLNRRILTVRQGVVRSMIDSPKNNKVRHIPLTNQIVKSLERCQIRVGWVFSLQNGGPMRHRALQKRILNASMR